MTEQERLLVKDELLKIHLTQLLIKANEISLLSPEKQAKIIEHFEKQWIREYKDILKGKKVYI